MSRTKISRTILIHLLVGLSLQGFAQPPDTLMPPDTSHKFEMTREGLQMKIYLAPVVIRYDIPPLSYTLYGEAELAPSAHENLGDFLSENGPVFIKSYGPGTLSTPSLRGMGASQALLSWEGIPLNSPLLGSTDLALLPVTFISSLEVLSGNSGLQIMSGGLGGAINLNTTTPIPDSTLILSLKQQFASFGRYSSNASVKFASESGRIRGKSSGYYLNAQNNFPYRDITQANQPVRVLEHAAVQQYGFLQQLDLSVTERLQLNATLWGQSADRELPPALLSVNANETQQDQFLRIKLGGKYQLNYTDKVDFQLAFFEEKLDYQNELAAIFSESKFQSYIASAWLYKGVKWGSVNAKVLARNDEALSSGFAQKQQQSRLAAAIDTRIFPQRKLYPFLQLRQEVIDGRLMPFLPMIGLSYGPRTSRKYNWSVDINLAKNYRAPTLNDLYWNPGGNPNLLPEKSWSMELNQKLSKYYSSKKEGAWKFSFDNGIYVSLTDNWIQWLPTQNGLWQPINVRKVISRGLESKLELTKKLRKAMINMNVHYTINLSNSVSESFPGDESVGKQLIYTPVHNMNARLKFIYKEHYHISWSTSVVGKRYVTPDHSSELPAYLLSGIRLGGQKKLRKHIFNYEIGAENIFNAQYQSIAWRPMPGRSFFINLGYVIH